MLHSAKMGRSFTLTDYDRVVSEIYEAALAPSRWDMALTRMVQLFDHPRWETAMLCWERIAPPAGRLLGSIGVDERARVGWAHGFAGNNHWAAGGHSLPMGAVVHSDDLVPREVFLASPFYTQFLSNFHYEVSVLALLDRHGSDHLGLCLLGPDNGPTTRIERALKLLIPHFQRAVRISRRIGEAELSAQSSQAALEAAPSAIMICDDKLRLGFANGHARQLLEQGYLYERGGMLSVPGEGQTALLRQLAAGKRDQPCLALNLHAGERPEIGAMVLRIDPDGVGGAANPAFTSPRLMIVAQRPHKGGPANIELLREWYSLTPAEARLAAMLAEGDSLDHFADLRGITRNTARFLLRGVFAKTGTTRQGQLVAQLPDLPLDWRVSQSEAYLPSPLG